MAKNKVKELRAVLQKDQGSIDNFMVQLSRNNQKLPDVNYKHVDENGWGKGINKDYTPFVDAIEMMDFIEEANKK